jgi:hypothetical protein
MPSYVFLFKGATYLDCIPADLRERVNLKIMDSHEHLQLPR